MKKCPVGPWEGECNNKDGHVCETCLAPLWCQCPNPPKQRQARIEELHPEKEPTNDNK